MEPAIRSLVVVWLGCCLFTLPIAGCGSDSGDAESEDTLVGLIVKTDSYS